MALFSRRLEPVGFLQSLRSLALGVVSHLQGAAAPDELAFVRRELEALERELAGGPGLLEDGELGLCEDCVAGVFAQLALAARATGPHAARERELFLQRCARDELERRLLALCRLVQGSAVLALRRPLLEQAVERHRPRRPQLARLCQKLGAVLGAGLLCLLSEAALAGRDPALLLGAWAERVAALHGRAEDALARCATYFPEQAREDVEQALGEAAAAAGPAELAAGILRKLEHNYDWLRWAVMAWQAPGPEPEAGQEEEVLAQGNFVAGRASSGLHVVACYQESPTALDRARTNRLIGELEWKLPNPPPEVYASLEAEPARASGYLARRMLQKLAEGLGPSVTVLVVPGKLAMKSSFPAEASLLHEYRHRLASGTVCIFG
ncbi:Protein rapunzel [Varanus komodoensis]|nr:Protein rapunzel [Varanus komodoensis]